MSRTAWPVAAVLALLIGAAAVAWGVAGLWSKAQAQRTALQLAQQRATQLEGAVQRLQHAQAVADALTHRLAQTEATLATTLKERHDALALATTGRACLRGPALRVLDGASGIRVAGLPGAAGGAAAAHAGPAAPSAHGPGRADGSLGAHPGAPGSAAAPAPVLEQHGPPDPVSTDTQVAAWMLAAGAQYTTCQARLDALIDWHQAQPQATPP